MPAPWNSLCAVVDGDDDNDSTIKDDDSNDVDEQKDNEQAVGEYGIVNEIKSYV